MLQGRHLTQILDLTVDEIHGLFDLAQGFKEISKRTIKKVPSLRGRTVINAFFENSTRTRTSFELAGKRLSADTVNISASGSAMAKGETLLDTARTIDAMQADAVIIRHHQSGSAQFLAKHLKARVINAGDGWHEHPSQALLDMFTIRERFGRLEGLEVAIVGDILHSRVARSNMLGLAACGARVRIVGPATVLPPNIEQAFGCERVGSLEQALDGAHVVMALRLQRERMQAGLLPDVREYVARYGIDTTRLAKARDDVMLMHPGPVNWGVELGIDIENCAQQVILEQVENGVAIRCAILYAILGGEQA